MDFIERLIETSVRAHGEIVARLIIDVDKEELIFIPANINHPKFLASRIRISLDELKQRPELVSHFVGVAVRIENNKIIEILVGISGLETVFSKYKKPLHTKMQVNKARDLILAVLQANNLLMGGFKLHMIYK